MLSHMANSRAETAVRPRLAAVNARAETVRPRLAAVDARAELAWP
ncbi:hypothetical protein [Nonomuraea sp. NPDC049158]